MRSIPFLILSGILLLLFFLSLLGSYTVINLAPASSPKLRKRIRYGYWIYSAYIMIHFAYLFIYPQTAATSINYKAYFLFNILLITDLFSKIVLSLFAIVHFLFKRKNRSNKTILWMGFILACIIVLTSFYGSVIGKNQLQIRNIEIRFDNLPTSFDGTKIVHVSDIHLGSFYSDSKLISKTTSALNSIDPDYIFFTGDLVNNFANELIPWKNELAEWKSKKGNFGIFGNHDYGDYFHWEDSISKTKNLQDIINGHEEIGFKLLRNSNVPLHTETDTMYLVGVENWGHPPFPQYADLEKAMVGIPINSFKILLTHDPAHWLSKVTGKTNIDLSLAGHTHGMQMGIKLAGIELSPMYWIRKQWGGLYQEGKQYLYVNRGFGTIGINWRIDMPPELTVITLKRSKINGN